MSPEAIQGGASNPLGGAPMKVGRPSDVWSLGCILYQVRAKIAFWKSMLACCGNMCHCACMCMEEASFSLFLPYTFKTILVTCTCMQMIYGRTPFADLPFIPKMNAICNPSHHINFPPCSNPAALDVMKHCLDRNPRTRITMQVCIPQGQCWAPTPTTRMRSVSALLACSEHLPSADYTVSAAEYSTAVASHH